MKKTTKTEILEKRAQISQKIEELELGFMARSLAQIGLPHSNLETNYFERTSGLVHLSITAHPKTGLPYGTYPRLLLAWICTEAVKTQNPILNLGSNQTEFLKKLNLHTGGSYISALKDQTNRLLSSLFRLDFADKQIRGFKNLILANEGFEFWIPHEGVWETQFKLSEEFFNDVLTNPVPLDLNVLHQIRKSPMAMDIYTWLAYRTFVIYKKGNRPVKISWADLQAQFGANYGYALSDEDSNHDSIMQAEQQGLINFRYKFIQSLKKLSDYYPQLENIIAADSKFLTVGGAKLIK